MVIQTVVSDLKAERNRIDKAISALERLTSPLLPVVLQVSNADKFVAERLSCVLRLPNRKGCR